MIDGREFFIKSKKAELDCFEMKAKTPEKTGWNLLLSECNTAIDSNISTFLCV